MENRNTEHLAFDEFLTFIDLHMHYTFSFTNRGSTSQGSHGTVNRWSLASIQCQRETPIWGTVKKETLFSANSSIGIQHSCEAALGPAPLQRDSSAPSAPLLSSVACSAPSWSVWCYAGPLCRVLVGSTERSTFTASAQPGRRSLHPL